MELPFLKELAECSDFSKTVEPFLPQLYELPDRLLQVLLGRQGPIDLYLKTNPLISAFAISLFLGAVFLVVSEINGNYSQVDRCWSILPTLYIAHFDVWARLHGIPSQRLDALLIFSTIWSVSPLNALLICSLKQGANGFVLIQTRLTYNYARKGGYNIGSEDYRWYASPPRMHICLIALSDRLPGRLSKTRSQHGCSTFSTSSSYLSSRASSSSS